MIRHLLINIASRKATLAGSAMGRQMLASLISETTPAAKPTLAYLDFTGIDLATGSFLREAVLGFRDFSRTAMRELYPVVCNANGTIEEELDVYLKDRNDAIWACKTTKSDEVYDPHILGQLDNAQRNTLQLIMDSGRVSAPELARLRPDEGVGVTAWNNRLAALAAKGIVIEFKDGKTKSFASVMEGLHGR